MEREPIIEPFGIRSRWKDWIQTNKRDVIDKVAREIIQNLSDKHGRVEVAAIIFFNIITGKVINVICNIGQLDEVYPPINYRRYWRPSIVQILIHNHPSGTRSFSDRDLNTMNSRFNRSLFGLGLLRPGIDDEFYIVVYNPEMDNFELIGEINM